MPVRARSLVRGGRLVSGRHLQRDTAVLKVCAEVCLRCGERLYSQETVRRFEQTRAKLERHETEEFKAIGISYQVA